MPKVIKNQLELHRGIEGNASNPYLNGSNHKKEESKGLCWTFVPKILRSRCSRTYIKSERNLRLIGSVASIALMLIIALTLVPVADKTEEADAASGTASSTTITVDTATASVDLTAASADGTFATSEGSGIASFGVTTTNYTGYTLTIQEADAATNPGKLVNTTDDTAYFDTISSVLDEKSFDSSTYNGKWGYKPSKYNGIDNVAFWPSPTSTTTLDVTEEANATANTYTISLGARADYTQVTGTYAKTMTLAATANAANYSVTYTDNTSDSSVANLPDATSSTTSTTAIALSSVTPSRTGYVFSGWCDEAPTSSGTVCGGTTYTVGDTYPIDQTTTNIITLYATWSVPTYTVTIVPGEGVDSVTLNSTACTTASGCTVSGLTHGTAYTLSATATSGYDFAAWSNSGTGTVASLTTASTTYTVTGASTLTAIGAQEGSSSTTTMQSFTSAMCTAMLEGDQVLLQDSRDDKYYSVAKLKDGNCWMLDNLALNLLDSTVQANLSSSTTNASDTTLNYLINGGGSGQYPASGVASSRAQSYVLPYIDTAYMNNAQVSYGNYYGNNGGGGNKIGVYYNYCAASAGSYCYASGSGTGDATEDVCPAGWRLPTGGSDGEFQALCTLHKGSACSNGDTNTNALAMRNALSTPLSGYFYNGSVYVQGSYGYFWSSTVSSGTNMYYLYVYSGNVHPLYTNNRYYGFSVRCVLGS